MTSTSTAPDHTTRLGTEPVGRLLRRACIQTTGAVGAYGIYALTNAWFVGYGVGETAMAAVNLVPPAAVARRGVHHRRRGRCLPHLPRPGRPGTGRPPPAQRATLRPSSGSAPRPTTTLGLAFLDPLLSLLGAHGELRESARPYAVVLLAGALVSTGFSSLVRAEGRMGYSTLLWVVPVAVQITLDPLLIFGLDMGVRGATLGTVGGQAVSAAMSLWVFFGQRDRPYRIGPKELLPHGATLRALLSIGLPSFLAGTGVTLLAVLVNATLAATGSATALAAYAVCVRPQTLVMMPHTGVSQGLQPIVGYNAGRGLADRALRAATSR